MIDEVTWHGYAYAKRLFVFEILRCSFGIDFPTSCAAKAELRKKKKNKNEYKERDFEKVCGFGYIQLLP